MVTFQQLCPVTDSSPAKMENARKHAKMENAISTVYKRFSKR
jgi:hypothetical protein